MCGEKLVFFYMKVFDGRCLWYDIKYSYLVVFLYEIEEEGIRNRNWLFIKEICMVKNLCCCNLKY